MGASSIGIESLWFALQKFNPIRIGNLSAVTPSSGGSTGATNHLPLGIDKLSASAIKGAPWNCPVIIMFTATDLQRFISRVHRQGKGRTNCRLCSSSRATTIIRSLVVNLWKAPLAGSQFSIPSTTRGFCSSWADLLDRVSLTLGLSTNSPQGETH